MKSAPGKATNAAFDFATPGRSSRGRCDTTRQSDINCMYIPRTRERGNFGNKHTLASLRFLQLDSTAFHARTQDSQVRHVHAQSLPLSHTHTHFTRSPIYYLTNNSGINCNLNWINSAVALVIIIQCFFFIIQRRMYNTRGESFRYRVTNCTAARD